MYFSSSLKDDGLVIGVECSSLFETHYNDVIMGAMASQITSVSIVYSTVCSDTDQRKHQSSASLAFVMGNSPLTGEFPAQMASNAENVSIWWRHHALNSSSYNVLRFTILISYYHFYISIFVMYINRSLYKEELMPDNWKLWYALSGLDQPDIQVSWFVYIYI